MLMIRIACEADVPEMHRIRLDVRENRLVDPSAIRAGDYLPMITARGRGWVAEVDGKIVGFAVADRARARIWALFVDSSHEGRGVGKALHDSMMTWLFGEGADRVWLGTDPGTRAERFYRSAGWQYLGIHHGEAKFEFTREQWMRGIAVSTPPA